MIDELEVMDIPDWLANVDSESIKNTPFPLKEVLAESLYYPSSGFDGDPVKFLAGNIFSFIYVDYSLTHKQLGEEIKSRGFTGYKVIASRDVTEKELTPNGWNPTPPKGYSGPPFDSAQPFCNWLIFKRDDDFSVSHGPSRFSLLHLCAEGVAAYEALYIANGVSPKAIAIIQPGTGWGGNWTDYSDPNEALGQIVLGNVSGQPELLLFGGIGDRKFYLNTCWPTHNIFITRVPKSGGGRIGFWKKSLEKSP